MDNYIRCAEAISLFCRINIHTKRELPIRASEMGLLIFLVKKAKDPTPLEVAKFFQVSKPMVTAMVRPLESKGYLEKIPSPVDGRSFALRPTQRAIDLVEDTCQDYIEKMEVLRSAMGSDDFDRFVGLIERANSILLETRGDG